MADKPTPCLKANFGHTTTPLPRDRAAQALRDFREASSAQRLKPGTYKLRGMFMSLTLLTGVR
jgi:hypothetical protein